MLLSIAFLDPKILGFLLTVKDYLTWGLKCEKLKFRIYFIGFEKWDSHLHILDRLISIHSIH